MVQASPKGSTAIHRIGAGGESLLAARSLANGSTTTVDVSGQERVEVIVGPGQYHIDETISIDLPVAGSKTIGSYLTASQTGNMLTLTATQDAYLHDVVGIG